jgi:hypothetical protein
MKGTMQIRVFLLARLADALAVGSNEIFKKIGWLWRTVTAKYDTHHDANHEQ